MLPLNRRVENDALPAHVESHAELDVLHRRVREPLLVETTELEEDVAPDGSEPGPKRGRNTGALVMNMVVEQVAEIGNDPAVRRIVIVGAEHSREVCVTRKRRADSSEGIVVNLDVRVDKDDDVPARPA
jgi:hypothetical protein